MLVNRYDYLRYDETAVAIQKNARDLVMQLEGLIKIDLAMPAPPPQSDFAEDPTLAARHNQAVAELARYNALARTACEELYMWIGKAVRNHQVMRGGSSEDVPQRTTDQ